MSTRRLSILCASLALLSAAGVAGCKNESGKVPVAGQVAFRGEPLERAAVTFFPDIGRPDTATVQNGAYSLELAPGNYTIVVLISSDVPPGYKEGDKIPPPNVILSEEYNSRLKSPLKATVAAAQSEPINFDLK